MTTILYFSILQNMIVGNILLVHIYILINNCAAEYAFKSIKLAEIAILLSINKITLAYMLGHPNWNIQLSFRQNYIFEFLAWRERVL